MGQFVKPQGVAYFAPSQTAPWGGTMPPVADKELMDVVDDLLDRNTNKISNVSELGRRMAELEPRQNAESWRKNLRSWRTKNAKEAHIALIARAFGVSRSKLPAAQTKSSVADLDRRLAAVEAAVGHVDEDATVGNLLEELATKLGDALERIQDLEAQSGFDGASPRVTL